MSCQCPGSLVGDLFGAVGLVHASIFHSSQDFRGVYSTLLEDWLSVDPVPMVDGQFEQPKFVEKNGNSA